MRPDKSHAETLIALEGQLQFGHEVQGGIIGGQKHSEGMVFFPEGVPEILQRDRGPFGEKLFHPLQKITHGYIQRRSITGLILNAVGLPDGPAGPGLFE